jgi:hypothetical protein
MHLDDLDGELCIVDENGNVTHVFERGDLSRAAYKHMYAWTKKNFDPKLEPRELWHKAEEAWDALTPEQQMLLWSMSVKEHQSAQDICTGLLATLSGYQGVMAVKQAFRDAIQSVVERFS